MTEAPAETTAQQPWKPLHRVLAIPRFLIASEQHQIKCQSEIQLSYKSKSGLFLLLFFFL